MEAITHRNMDSAPKDSRRIWVLFSDGSERRVSWWDCSWLRVDFCGAEGDPDCTDCWVTDDGHTFEVYDAIGWRPADDAGI